MGSMKSALRVTGPCASTTATLRADALILLVRVGGIPGALIPTSIATHYAHCVFVLAIAFFHPRVMVGSRYDYNRVLANYGDF